MNGLVSGSLSPHCCHSLSLYTFITGNREEKLPRCINSTWKNYCLSFATINAFSCISISFQVFGIFNCSGKRFNCKRSAVNTLVSGTSCSRLGLIAPASHREAVPQPHPFLPVFSRSPLITFKFVLLPLMSCIFESCLYV